MRIVRPDRTGEQGCVQDTRGSQVDLAGQLNDQVAVDGVDLRFGTCAVWSQQRLLAIADGRGVLGRFFTTTSGARSQSAACPAVVSGLV